MTRVLALARALTLALTLAAAAAVSAPPHAAAQEVILRLHQMLPPQAAIPAKAPVPWIEQVGQESGDRKGVREGKSVAVRVELGGRRRIKKTQHRSNIHEVI